MRILLFVIAVSLSAPSLAELNVVDAETSFMSNSCGDGNLDMAFGHDILTEAQELAFLLYTSNGAFNVTSAIKSDDVDSLEDCFKWMMTIMDYGLKQLPDPRTVIVDDELELSGDKSIVVYRGTNTGLTQLDDNVSSGDIITIDHYVSTSIFYDVAIGFATEYVNSETGTVFMRRLIKLHSFSGKKIPSRAGGEKEILMPRGLSYEVVVREIRTSEFFNYETGESESHPYEFLELKEVLSP